MNADVENVGARTIKKLPGWQQDDHQKPPILQKPPIYGGLKTTKIGTKKTASGTIKNREMCDVKKRHPH